MRRGRLWPETRAAAETPRTVEGDGGGGGGGEEDGTRAETTRDRVVDATSDDDDGDDAYTVEKRPRTRAASGFLALSSRRVRRVRILLLLQFLRRELAEHVRGRHQLAVQLGGKQPGLAPVHASRPVGKRQFHRVAHVISDDLPNRRGRLHGLAERSVRRKLCLEEHGPDSPVIWLLQTFGCAEVCAGDSRG